MRKCYFCGKTYIWSITRKKLRGKYNPTSKKKKYPNLQWVRLSNGKRVKACTRCIRSLFKIQKTKVRSVV